MSAAAAKTLGDDDDGAHLGARSKATVQNSTGDFPICTDVNDSSPFCLPRNGSNLTVDATYYVTWNPDYYPLNATITIELRYSSASQGDSAFTSEKTANSYGYISLYMHKEWLQGKSKNNLTLYIIELDPSSGTRASARQGPTVTLHPKPVQHYKPPPQLPFNRLALMVGLPVSLSVVVGIVAGLFFGMREHRKIPIGAAMGSRGKRNRNGRLRGRRRRGYNTSDLDRLDGLRAMKKYTDDFSEPTSTMTDLERNDKSALKSEVKPKGWNGS